MSGAYSIDLRERIVAFAEEGHTHRETSERFKVAISFVNKLVKQKRELGHLNSLPAGGKRHGKLDPFEDWIRSRLEEKSDITLRELSAELAEQGTHIHYSAIGRFLHRLGLSYKKNSHSR